MPQLRTEVNGKPFMLARCTMALAHRNMPTGLHGRTVRWLIRTSQLMSGKVRLHQTEISVLSYYLLCRTTNAERSSDCLSTSPREIAELVSVVRHKEVSRRQSSSHVGSVLPRINVGGISAINQKMASDERHR